MILRSYIMTNIISTMHLQAPFSALTFTQSFDSSKSDSFSNVMLFHPKTVSSISWSNVLFTLEPNVHCCSYNDSAAVTWLVVKVCCCSSPLEVSHGLGYTINRLLIITYPGTNATWAWIPRKHVQVRLWKKIMGISKQASFSFIIIYKKCMILGCFFRGALYIYASLPK